MKKIIFILFSTLFLWGGYESTFIWTQLESSSNDRGRVHLTDRNGVTITDLPKKGGYTIMYKGDLDSLLIQEIISIEDRRFFSHHGIDIPGKIGAILDNYEAGTTVRGGSTLTEQYIKNQYFPDAKRTISQKIQESFWAIIAEMEYSKEEILVKYLDSIYMGNGVYGIGSMLSIYFSETSIENLSEISRREILTRIKYPNLTSGSRAYSELMRKKLNFQDTSLEFPKREKPKYTNIFPYLTERIKNEISAYCNGEENTLNDFVLSVPSTLCNTNDTTLISSIDTNIGLRAISILEGTLAPLEGKNVHNGAIYVWSEKEKKVLAYIGNRANAQENAVDMITRHRSVGSVLKPFVYLMALIRGASPDSLILDDTRSYETANAHQAYIPENYIPKSYGPIPLREALGNSLNSATVRLSESLGIGRIYDMFRGLGFPLDHEAGYYGYGISLGTVELSLENIVKGYRSLTNLKEKEKFLLYDILSDTSNRARTFGISSILNTSVPLAVKTGTSTDFRDNWVIGYTPDIIIGVWVGNTNHESMDDVSGVTGAGPLYHGLAEVLIANGYIRPTFLSLPPGITETFLCLDIKCLQKKSSHIREGYTRKSRPQSNMYYKEDFITSLTKEEEEKWKIQ